MNKQKTTETDKLFLENFYSKTHKFTIKSNSRNTDWIVDLFPQVKSAKHMAKLYLISVSDRAYFPIYLENSIKNFKKRL